MKDNEAESEILLLTAKSAALTDRVRELEERMLNSRIGHNKRVAALEEERNYWQLEAAKLLTHQDSRIATLEAENAALRRELQDSPGEGCVTVPAESLPTAEEVYGILTPCPCRFADQPEHGPGWCARGREIDEEDLASDEP